jgi:hypothetical protein
MGSKFAFQGFVFSGMSRRAPEEEQGWDAKEF